MKYVAAYMLLALKGEENIDNAKLKALLEGCDCEVNEDSLTSVISALKGKKLNELINNGLGKVCAMGGGSGSGAAGAGAGAAEEKEEEKEEEEEEESVEEESVDMDMGGLFDF